MGSLAAVGSVPVAVAVRVLRVCKSAWNLDGAWYTLMEAGTNLRLDDLALLQDLGDHIVVLGGAEFALELAL